MKWINTCPRWLFYLLAAAMQLLLAAGFVLVLHSDKPSWECGLSYAALPTWNTPEVRISSFAPTRGNAETLPNDALIFDALRAVSVDYYNTQTGGDGSTISYEILTDKEDIFCYRIFDTNGRGASWTVTVSMPAGSVPLIAVDKGGDTP